MSDAANTCYADRACQHTVTIVENVRLARDTYRVRFTCPEIAARIVPGQFIMLRLAGCDDPVLGRPLALYDTVLSDGSLAETAQPIGIDVVYLVVGKLTARLSKYLPGQQLEIWGPLGNGFPPVATQHLLMVAGGIGQTPFMALAREYLGLQSYGQSVGNALRGIPAPVLNNDRASARASKVTFCYGARTKDYLAGVEDFRQLGVDVRISTDDGSAGHHGLVTDLARQVISEQPKNETLRIVCCGPERMMEAVAHLAASAGVPCQVSLETPMACGIGICFSCVTKVRQPDGDWDYRRTCVEGPVFDAASIVW